jgi:hypothetical protein
MLRVLQGQSPSNRAAYMPLSWELHMGSMRAIQPPYVTRRRNLEMRQWLASWKRQDGENAQGQTIDRMEQLCLRTFLSVFPA